MLFFPYAISSPNVGLFGLLVATIFFSVLTIGFIVEIGTGVIKLDSKPSVTLPSQNSI